MENLLLKFDPMYWFLENLLWELVFIPILFFIWYLGNAFFLAKYLLKNNRFGLGAGAKWYLADRFVQLWYNQEKTEYKTGKSYSPQKGFMYAYMHTSTIDDKLVEKKLIQLDRDPKRKKDILIPYKTLKNKLVLFFVEFYLIHFFFDGRDYYKNLKKKN
jgi:hypothetical protein